MTALEYLQCKSLKTIVLILLTLTNYVYEQIISSSDLNCNFKSICQWRNVTSNEFDKGLFAIDDHVYVDQQRLTAKENDLDDRFAYTHSTIDGLQSAELISDVVSCQLGGAVLKFWYYRSDVATALEACIRQPPGSLLASARKCFPVFIGNNVRQWLYAAVEFPPISQPFELIIKAIFNQPRDIIMIDDIAYDAILCENGYIQQTADITPIINNHTNEPIITANSLTLQRNNVSADKVITANEPQLNMELSHNLLLNGNNDTENFISFAEKVMPMLIPAIFKLLKPKTEKAQQVLNEVNSPETLKTSVPSIVPVNSYSLDKAKVSTNQIESKQPLNTSAKSFSSSTLPVAYKQKNFWRNKTRSMAVKDTKKLTPQFGFSIVPTGRRQLKVEKMCNYTDENRFSNALLRTISPSLSFTEDYDLLKVTESPAFTSGNDIKEMMARKRRNPFKEMKRRRKKYDKFPVTETMKTSKTESSTEANFIWSRRRPVASSSTVAPVSETDVQLSSRHFPQFYVKVTASPQVKKIDKKQMTKKMLKQFSILKNVPNLEEIINDLDLSLLKTPDGFKLLKQQFLEKMIQHIKKSRNHDVRVTSSSNALINKSTAEVLNGLYGNFNLPGNFINGVKQHNCYDLANDTTTKEVINEDWSSKSEQSCSAVNCNFDDSTVCSYTENPLEDDIDMTADLPLGVIVQGWKLSKINVGNSLTGIKQDSEVKAGNADSRQVTYLLSTTYPFSLADDSELQFKYHLAGKHGRLQVFLDNAKNCLFDASGSNITKLSRNWQLAKILIPKGTHVLHFIADNLIANYVIGLDDIRLTKRDSFDAAKCYF
uniref:MAM domain-containing protein n=1 Tax=Syphacia muris TaxID=451379 RepID=A0A0N5AAB2_9BILA